MATLRKNIDILLVASRGGLVSCCFTFVATNVLTWSSNWVIAPINLASSLPLTVCKDWISHGRQFVHPLPMFLDGRASFFLVLQIKRNHFLIYEEPVRLSARHFSGELACLSRYELSVSADYHNTLHNRKVLMAAVIRASGERAQCKLNVRALTISVHRLPTKRSSQCRAWSLISHSHGAIHRLICCESERTSGVGKPASAAAEISGGGLHSKCRPSAKLRSCRDKCW